MEPYWDMGNPVTICAFDAQTTEISSSGNDCSTRDGQSDPECGCGPIITVVLSQYHEGCICGEF